MHILGRKGEGVKILSSGKRAYQRESPSHCISVPVGVKGWRLPPGSSGDAGANRGAETMGAGLLLLLQLLSRVSHVRLCATP